MVSARDALGPDLKQFVADLDTRNHIGEIWDEAERRAGGQRQPRVTVSAKSSVADAIRTMHAQKVGGAGPDAEACPVGIFTSATSCACLPTASATSSACRSKRDDLQHRRRTAAMSVDEALGLMTERRFRHLPLMRKASSGLVSIGDLVKVKLEETAQRRRRCAPTSRRALIRRAAASP